MPAMINFEPEVQFEPLVDFTPEEDKGPVSWLKEHVGKGLDYAKEKINEAVPGFLDQATTSPIHEELSQTQFRNQAKAGDSPATAIEKGVKTKLAGFADMMTSPAMLATTGAGGVIPALSKPVAAAFLVDTVSSIPRAFKAVQEASKTPAGSQQRVEAGIDLASLLTFTHLLSKHATGKAPELPRLSEAEKPSVAEQSDTATAAQPQIQFEEIQGEHQPDSSSTGVESIPSSTELLQSQPEATQVAKVSPHDFVPALKTESEYIIGDKGQTHKDIYDAQPDPIELRASDPAHGFMDQNDKFWTREEVSKALGEKEPMQSERLRELQAQEPGDTRSTGISQAINEQRGSGVEPGTGIGPEAAVNLGREDLKAGANPEAIAAKVDRGEPIGSRETGVLRAHLENLDRIYDRAQDAAHADPSLKPVAEAAFKASNDFRARIKPAATEASNVFRTYQGSVDVETGTFSGLRRMVNDVKGRDVRPEEVPKLKTQAEKVQRAQAAESAARAKLDKAIGKSKQPKSLNELRAHFAEKLKGLSC